MTENKYSVLFWGSDPDEDNDDCWYGVDFDELGPAREEFDKVCTDREVAFIELDGPEVYRKRSNPNFDPDTSDDDEWRREIAREAGMLHGCQGYNEVMGWD